MPFDRKRYPDNWREISLRIRQREGNCCKWCGVANGAVGARHPVHGWKDAEWWVSATAGEYGADAGRDELPKWWPKKFTKIVLTVAHLGTAHPDGTPGDKHDKMDVRDENLAALCQRCHLTYDIDEHLVNAKASRRKKQLARQPEFFQ